MPVFAGRFAAVLPLIASPFALAAEPPRTVALAQIVAHSAPSPHAELITN